MSADDTREILAELKQGVELLTRLIQGHSEQLDTQRDWINQLGSRMEELAGAQANSEQKIAALADAQIRTEDSLSRLAEAGAHTDQRLDALIDIVRGLQGGQA